jgi:acyl-coenzyme A thioesterase PaaI-like protein
MVSENEGTASPDLAVAVAQMPFAAALGVVLDAAAAEEVRGRLAWAPERCTTAGIMHGGVLMGLADSLGGLSAVSRPLHIGRTTIAVQTDLADGAGRRVAQVTQVQAVLGGDRGR